MLFNLFIILSVLTIIYYGFLIVRIDLSLNKIPNEILFKIIKIGLALNFTLLLLTMISNLGYSTAFFSPPHKSFFISIFVNSSFSLIAAYLLWKYRIWAAGDAKMFFTFSFLFPLTLYKYVEINVFPSFTILINIFMVSSFYLFVKSILYFKSIIIFWLVKPKELYKYFIGQLINKKLSYFFQFLHFFFLFYVFFRVNTYMKDFLFNYFDKINISPLSNYFLPAVLLIFLPKLKKIIRKKQPTIILFVVVFILDFYLMNSLSDLRDAIYLTIKNIFIFTVVLGAFDYVFSLYIKNKDTKTVLLNELREGMILSDESLLDIKNRDFYEKMEEIYPEGLMKEQIEIIKNGIKEKDYYLSVYSPKSFASWIYIGFIFTLLFGQSIPTLISRYL